MYKLKFFVDPIRYMRSINNPKKFIWKTCLYFTPPDHSVGRLPGPVEDMFKFSRFDTTRKNEQK